MKKSKSYIVYCITIFSVILVSCEQFNLLFKSTPTSHSEWLEEWLIEPTCSPPCWEQLIPGKTDIDEGLSVIKNLKDVSIRYLPTKGPYDNRKQMMWDFDNTASGGSATTDKNGDVISDISLHVNSEENLRISEIFSLYGPPEYVNIIGCFGELTRSSCDVHLVYPKIGMSLGLYLPDQGRNGHKVEITSDSNVRTINLFNPGVNNYLEALGVFDNLVIWTGYQEYLSINP